MPFRGLFLTGYLNFRALDAIHLIIFFTTKLILYFKIYKYVSETLNILNLNKNVKRRKIKRVKFKNVFI